MKCAFVATAVFTAALSALSATAEAGILNRIFSQSSTKPVAPQVIPFTTFDAERQAAQKNLVCKWISLPPVHQRSDFDFLCKGGTWATVSYILDRNAQDSTALGRARLVWRQWHPNAHPSGGEAYAVQPFLTHVLHHLVPANQAQDVEYAFWQTKNRVWQTKDLEIVYTHSPKSDHNIHRLEIIGRAPKLGLATAQKPVPRKVEPQFQPPQQVIQAVQPVPVAPNLPLPTPRPPEPKEPTQAYSPTTFAPEPPKPEQIAPPSVQKSLTTPPVQAPTSVLQPGSQVSGQSSGHAVPAYRALVTDRTDSPVQSTPNIPTLKKQDKLDLGTAVNIPPPPSALLPVQDPLKNIFESNPTIQKNISEIVKEQSDGNSTVGVPLKNQLLQDYYRAENNTQRYRNRAEGSQTPLGEKIIEEELNTQPPQPVKPLQN